MTRQEIDGTLQAMGMILHLQVHIHEMAEREEGLLQEALRLCDETMTNTADAMRTVVMGALMLGRDDGARKN